MSVIYDNPLDDVGKNSFVFMLIGLDQFENAIREKKLSLLRKKNMRVVRSLLPTRYEDAKAILNGTVTIKNNPEFNLVLAPLACAIGAEEVQAPVFEYVLPESLNGVGIFKWLRKPIPPAGLPKPKELPFVSHLYLDDIIKLTETWQKKKLDKYAPEIKERIQVMLDVFQKAIKKKKDIISFEM